MNRNRLTAIYSFL